MNKARRPICVRRPRRGTQAILQLIQEYEASGESRGEFCREHDLGMSTLDRYLHNHRKTSQTTGCELVPVELAVPSRVSNARALTVVLARGHRIEVDVGFDAAMLMSLIGVLEGR